MNNTLIKRKFYDRPVKQRTSSTTFNGMNFLFYFIIYSFIFILFFGGEGGGHLN